MEYIGGIKRSISCYIANIDYVIKPPRMNLIEEFVLRAAVEFGNEFTTSELAYLLGIDYSVMGAVVREMRENLRLLYPGEPLTATVEGVSLHTKAADREYSETRHCHSIYTPFLENTQVILPDGDGDFLAGLATINGHASLSIAVQLTSEFLESQIRAELSRRLSETHLVEIEVLSIAIEPNVVAMLWELNIVYEPSRAELQLHAVNLSDPLRTNVVLSGKSLADRCTKYGLKMSELSGISESTLLRYSNDVF